MADKQVELIVRLEHEAAASLRSGGISAGEDSLAEVKALLSKERLTISPQFAANPDGELGSYFVVSEVPADGADQLVARLQALGVVDAVYVQPAPSPP